MDFFKTSFWNNWGIWSLILTVSLCVSVGRTKFRRRKDDESILEFLISLYDDLVLWFKVKPKQDFCLESVPSAPDYTKHNRFFDGGWMAFDLPDKDNKNTTNGVATRSTNADVDTDSDTDKGENPLHVFDVDIFYIHPTSYGIFNGTSWNAPINDPISSFISYFNMHAQAGAFRNFPHPIPLNVLDENIINQDGTNERKEKYVSKDSSTPSIEKGKKEREEKIGEKLKIHTHLFAPRYRQLTLSYLKANEKDSNVINNTNYQQAQNIAYLDVSTAFQYYLKYSNRPFILVSHSQGTFRAIQLLIDHIDPYPDIRKRFLAGYLLGGMVPVSIFRNELKFIKPSKNETDLGCVIAWDLIPNEFPSRTIAERNMPNPHFQRYIYSNVNLDTENILLDENEDEVHSTEGGSDKLPHRTNPKQYNVNHSHSALLTRKELERIKKTRIRRRRSVRGERCIVTCPYTWSSHIPTSARATVEEDLVLIRGDGNMDDINQRHKGLPLGITRNILNQYEPTGKWVFPNGLPATIEGDYLVIPNLQKYSNEEATPNNTTCHEKDDEVPIQNLQKKSKLPLFYTYQIWNTYHIQDFAVFHFNIRQNAQERIRAYYQKYACSNNQ